MEVPALMEAMREKYDGFCFDEDASIHVYAPWSVLSFLQTPRKGLRNFWYDSAGRSSMVLNYLKNFSIEKPESFAHIENIALWELSGSNDIETLKPEVFLFQAGYLSIKERCENEIILGYPNREVEESMAQLYVSQMVEGKTFISMGVGSIKKLLSKGNPEEAVTAFNTIFLHIPYDKYPVTSEASCRMGIMMILIGAGLYSDLEKQNALGRSDLEFNAGDFHWVMEFKYIPMDKRKVKEKVTKEKDIAKRNSLENWKETKNPDILLAEALTQMKEKRYGEGLKLGNKKLLRVGLVFDGTARQFVRYGVV